MITLADRHAGRLSVVRAVSRRLVCKARCAAARPDTTIGTLWPVWGAGLPDQPGQPM